MLTELTGISDLTANAERERFSIVHTSIWSARVWQHR